MSNGLLGEVLGGFTGNNQGGGLLGRLVGAPFQIFGSVLGAGTRAVGGGLMQMLMPFILIFIGVELAFKLIDKLSA